MHKNKSHIFGYQFKTMVYRRSKCSDVDIGALVQLGALKNLIKLIFLRHVLSKGRVSPHKVINIDNLPRPKPILPQPFHQGLQLIATFKVFWCYHLILHDAQMLRCVDLTIYVELLDIYLQW